MLSYTNKGVTDHVLIISLWNVNYIVIDYTGHVKLILL